MDELVRTKISNIPSFIQYYNNVGVEKLENINDIVNNLKALLPLEVSQSIQHIIQENEGNIIEDDYIKYIQSKKQN